jgi:hypothetical protein
VGTSFYKLEMMSLQLDSFSGVQVMHCEWGKPSNLDYLLQDWAISVNKLWFLTVLFAHLT